MVYVFEKAECLLKIMIMFFKAVQDITLFSDFPEWFYLTQQYCKVY